MARRNKSFNANVHLDVAVASTSGLVGCIASNVGWAEHRETRHTALMSCRVSLGLSPAYGMRLRLFRVANPASRPARSFVPILFGGVVVGWASPTSRSLAQVRGGQCSPYFHLGRGAAALANMVDVCH